MNSKILNYQGITLNLMNTNITIYCHHTQTHDAWKVKMAKWFSYVSNEWSRFEKNNSLEQFNNQQQGKRIQVSPLFFEVLYASQEYAKQTNFYFNPFLLENIEELGYDKSFPLLKRKESNPSIKPPRLPLSEVLEFDPTSFTVQKTMDCKVDLGGFAKGWSVDYAAKWLKQQACINTGFVNAGGDLIVWSSFNEPWNISIANPFRESEIIHHISIKDGAIATSNTIYRKWAKEKKEYHHILNGRTGKCANSNVIQATVIGPSIMEAEVLTKILIILGSVNGVLWLNEHYPHVSYIIVCDNGQVLKGGKRYGAA